MTYQADPPSVITPTVAILGGGLSGAAVAYHLALSGVSARIVVIEPREVLGAGLAYSASDPEHRLNVPDAKMTLRADTPDHYARWLDRFPALRQPGDVAPNGDIFTPRATFARYVAAELQPFLESGRVEHLRQTALAVEPEGARVRIVLSSGSLVADILVLALSHPKPFLPPELRPLLGDPRLVADPFIPGALDRIGLGERLLIIGSGLTSADILATLVRRGFAGQVTALSRHGWQPQRHGPKQAVTAADFAAKPARTARALLRRVRAAVAEDAKQGLTWHATFDRLRAQGRAIWAALPEPERVRFLRHLRSLWDIHRFRIAPQTAAAGEKLAAAGQYNLLAARLVAAEPGETISVTLRPRGQAEVQELEVDRILLATGPHHASIIPGTPVLSSLARAGLIASDRTRLGIATDEDGTARASGSHQAPELVGRIFIAGPLARGTVGELMGVPEVVDWSEHIARTVRAELARIGARAEVV